MLIDWFTVGAQVVNFLILVWLLKHFLYRPILQAIAVREQRIASELAAAQTAQAAAQTQRDEFEQKNAAFEQARAELMNKLMDETKAGQARLMVQAREESNALRVQWQQGLHKEYQNLSGEIIRRTQDEVFAIARKTLMDLAGTSLEARMVEIFIQHVQEIKLELRTQLAAAIKTGSAPLLVQSAYVLTTAQRGAIVDVLGSAFGSDCPVAFETASGIVCGLELTANGQKLAWSVADYLGTLQQKVSELLSKPAVLIPSPDEPHD